MTNKKKLTIPFIALDRQTKSIPGLANSILTALSEFNFVKGKQVAQFESEFADRLTHKPQVIATANGTDSLFLCLKALGISAEDEVLTPAFSWISSSETIALCGAKPVFVDVDPIYYTIDPASVISKISTKTRAVICVHLYGQAAPMTELAAICQQHNLFLIEDCAQAHLTLYDGKTTGTFGDASAFSFYPTKNLGAYGDAGCVSTCDTKVADKVRRFANHGALEKDDHLFEGMNSRMDTIQATVLLEKLPLLNAWNDERRQHAHRYDTILESVSEVITPRVRPNTTHVFHLYVIRAKNRDKLRSYLFDNGIQCLVHYPSSLPNSPAYRHLHHRPDDFPVATCLQDEVLSLPIYPELGQDEIGYICEKIKAFYRK
jgi:dTDP-4-amino-4,6-dideoxygalactose transaminase